MIHLFEKPTDCAPTYQKAHTIVQCTFFTTRQKDQRHQKYYDLTVDQVMMSSIIIIIMSHGLHDSIVLMTPYVTIGCAHIHTFDFKR